MGSFRDPSPLRGQTLLNGLGLRGPKNPISVSSLRTMSTEPVYSMTAPEIAAVLGVTARTVRMWAEAGDLPRLSRGQFDVSWATWLVCGRKVSARWRAPSVHVTVAAGWLQFHDRAPTNADAEALGGLFKRNGFSLSEAMKSLGAAQALMGRA